MQLVLIYANCNLYEIQSPIVRLFTELACELIGFPGLKLMLCSAKPDGLGLV